MEGSVIAVEAPKMIADKDPLIINEEDVEKGGETIVDDFAYRNNVANASVQVRLGFLRKVFSLLAFQLLLTVVFCGVCMFVGPVQFFIRNNLYMVPVSFFSSVVVLIALHLKRRSHPANLILLAAFTLVQAYSVAIIISYYDQIVVFKALILTLSVQIGLTVFTLQSKRDFSILGSSLFAAINILIIGEILFMFFGGSLSGFSVSLVGALVFSLFIIYDTHMIMYELSPEEYILATINLYMDGINFFIYVLRIMGETKRN